MFLPRNINPDAYIEASFFTVYGPAGRPDMAYFGFTNKLLKGESIQIFNYGNCKRDFTYVDDIVESVLLVMNKGHKELVPMQSGDVPVTYNEVTMIQKLQESR